MRDAATDMEFMSPLCLDCGYCLLGLAEHRCPECGREFDPADPASFTRRPPVVRWRLWMPGMLLSTILGTTAIALLVAATNDVGIAVTLGIPGVIGCMVGYLCRVRFVFHVSIVICVAIGIVVSIAGLNLAGMFCTIIALPAILGPMLVGSAFGAALRKRLKRSAFSQRWHLPVLLLAFATVAGTIESAYFRNFQRISITTSRSMRLAPGEAFAAARFFEETDNDPPFLMRLGAPRPARLQGVHRHVGAIERCVYKKGFVTKRLTEYDPGRRIAFDVLEQSLGFERSVLLRNGSFTFDEDRQGGTIVRVTTEYDALLRPRFIWEPFERATVGQLHDHILSAIEGP